MKHVLCAALLLWSSHSVADVWLTVPAYTYHADRLQGNGQRWNERNTGVGLELGTERDMPSIVLGMYRNSFNRDTQYAGVKWEPLRLGPLGFGAIAGLATGYRLPFVAGLATSLTDKNGNGVVAIWAPKATPDTSAFVSLQLRIRL